MFQVFSSIPTCELAPTGWHLRLSSARRWRLCRLDRGAKMSTPSTPTPSTPSHVALVIKSPTSEAEAPLRLSVSLDGTVGDIKERLTETHPDHPPPKDQRLIFAGKILTDNSRTADILKQVNQQCSPVSALSLAWPGCFHMFVTPWPARHFYCAMPALRHVYQCMCSTT